MAEERVARHHARLETKALFCMGQEAAELAERREAQLEAVESDASNASVSTNPSIEQDRKDMREELPPERLQCCTSDLVQVQIAHTPWKQCTAKFLFPPEYPDQPVITQLASTVLEEEMLKKLETACEKEASKHLRKAQVLHVYYTLDKHIRSNFSPAFAEIKKLKQYLQPPHSFTLAEKAKALKVHLQNGNYVLDLKLEIGDQYPLEPVRVSCIVSTFPQNLSKLFIQHANNLARKLALPPALPSYGAGSVLARAGAGTSTQAKKKQPEQTTLSRYQEAAFQHEKERKVIAAQTAKEAALKKHVPKPSIMQVLHYLKEEVVEQLPSEPCCLCKNCILPKDPMAVQAEDSESKDGLEHLYCGHFFHFTCLKSYITTPPFGKGCPKCGHPIHHHNFVTNKQVLEHRWANKQAKQREIDDIKDMFA
mmetsp:Transcript_2011/g.12848  ORF Transcript_2011/g.12848 Transcript_2011/m.12848 type:complete len:424 (+) Transcript_2011:1268-2539(+)